MPPPKNQKRRQQLAAARSALQAKKLRQDDGESSEQVTSIQPRLCASRVKMELMKNASNTSENHALERDMAQVWALCHMLQLTRLIDDLFCPMCFEDGMMAISVCETENQGFASKLKLSCSSCGFEKCMFSSPKIDASDSVNVAYEINPKMVLFSHEIGKSHTALDTFAAVVGIPNMHLSTYQGHDKTLSGYEVDAGEELLQRTATVVRKAYGEVDPEIQEALDSGETPVIDIPVSYDGTWMKRGFTSLYGVGVCIDVLTGLVVDYAVLSKFCHACKLKEASLPADQLAEWKREHAPDCCINHTRSSKAMEQDAAVMLWGRSEQKLKFRYVEMLSDGDSSAYKAVTELQPYGDTEIKKLECVNHAHKRMGTALRKLSKEERLGGRGTGKLTAAKCDSLQNFYRGAILDNIPDVDKMRNAVWAGLWHFMSTDEQPRHFQCPKSRQSWCWYQRAIANGEEPCRHEDHPSNTFLSVSVAHKLIPVYRRMSDEALMRKMAHGGTQNTNECLNASIWARCPKTSFMGLRRVQGSVARAVCTFNEGATEVLTIMNKLYVDISNITVQLMTKKDQRRVKKCDSTTNGDARQRRREYAKKCRTRIRTEEANDGNVYGAGEH